SRPALEASSDSIITKNATIIAKARKSQNAARKRGRRGNHEKASICHLSVLYRRRARDAAPQAARRFHDRADKPRSARPRRNRWRRALLSVRWQASARARSA